jgi:cytochrome b6-f complex iron-sulfur subunit
VSETEHSNVTTDELNRRGFLSTSSILMGAGLAGGYGTLGYFMGRFLYSHESRKLWLFATTLDDLTLGQSLPFVTPGGAKVVIARQREGDTSDCFIALSSVCPHLGCQVHWEGANSRFFCPCHNGAFDAQGKPLSGPPQAANQSLSTFALKVENRLVFIEVAAETIASQSYNHTRS